MKTAGAILSTLFDEQFIKKAQGYSKLFDSWADITEKNGIASAAAHSRIKELDRGILLVEMDHPGWKQILQTKQSKLLNDFRRRFPDLDISGISLILGRSEPEPENSVESAKPAESVAEPTVSTEPKESAAEVEEPAEQGYNAIKDEAFKETLKKLEQNIKARERLGLKKERK